MGLLDDKIKSLEREYSHSETRRVEKRPTSNKETTYTPQDIQPRSYDDGFRMYGHTNKQVFHESFGSVFSILIASLVFMCIVVAFVFVFILIIPSFYPSEGIFAFLAILRWTYFLCPIGLLVTTICFSVYYSKFSKSIRFSKLERETKSIKTLTLVTFIIQWVYVGLTLLFGVFTLSLFMDILMIILSIALVVLISICLHKFNKFKKSYKFED